MISLDELKALADTMLPASVDAPATPDFERVSFELGALINDHTRVSAADRDAVLCYMTDRLVELLGDRNYHPLIGICMREFQHSYDTLDTARLGDVEKLVIASRPFLTDHEALYLSVLIVQSLNRFRGQFLSEMSHEYQEDRRESGGGRITPSA